MAGSSTDPTRLAAEAAVAASVAADRATDAEAAASEVAGLAVDVRKLAGAVTSLHTTIEASLTRSRRWRAAVVLFVLLGLGLAGVDLIQDRTTTRTLEAVCLGRNDTARAVTDILRDAEASAGDQLTPAARAFYARSYDRLRPIPCTDLLDRPKRKDRRP